MQNDLKALEQRWGLALQSASFGVWDLDPLAHRVHYSPEWKQMLGYGSEDTPDSTATWRARVHPDDLEPMKSALDAHLQGHTPSYSAEFRLRTAAGDYRWVLSRGRVAARDADGRAQRVVGTLTDLTDRRELEALRAERDSAAATQLAKSEFLSRMSHELRTPLNAVLGFAQLLRTQLGSSDLASQQRQLGHIEQAGWALLGLVNDVLDLARAESGQLPLQHAAVPLAQAWTEVMGAQAAQATAREVTVQADTLPAQACVWADAARLRQVLAQLLGNAIQHNHPGGTVRLQLAAATGPDGAPRWQLLLQNDGPGIAAEELPHVFEPFNRLGRRPRAPTTAPTGAPGVTGSTPAASADTAPRGVGLGLALSRWLVQQMGGEISLASSPGQGTTVRLLLPAAPAAATATATSTAAVPSPRASAAGPAGSRQA